MSMCICLCVCGGGGDGGGGVCCMTLFATINRKISCEGLFIRVATEIIACFLHVAYGLVTYILSRCLRP